MSDQPQYEDGESRRHGLWGLGVLVMIAIIVVAFMILFTGTNTGKSKDDNGTTVYGSSAFGASPSGTSPSGRSSSHSPSKQPGRHHVKSQSTAVAPCTDASKACPVSGDVTQVADAINALREQHGLNPVAASGSEGAQECAAAHGAGSTCFPHYIYAELNSTDGAAAVKALQSVNESWLLAPDATKIEVGWAEEPQGGRFDCVVLRFP